jgi:uncharacterized protein (UPF0128 family)
MEKNFFENAQKLIHEHDELIKLKKDLVNVNTSIGIIYNNEFDSAGINYTKYSNDVKDLIKKFIDIRLCEIEKQFN